MGTTKRREVDLVGVDLNPWAKKVAEEARQAGAPLRFETANVFDFASASPFDFVISSLFMHHLTDRDNVLFLRWMEVHARMAGLSTIYIAIPSLTSAKNIRPVSCASIHRYSMTGRSPLPDPLPLSIGNTC